jgi:hypothetical protein
MPTLKKTSPSVHPSERKLRSLRSLSPLGVKVSDGYDYGLHEDLAQADLKETRKALSSIKGSLADEIARDRDKD